MAFVLAMVVVVTVDDIKDDDDDDDKNCDDGNEEDGVCVSKLLEVEQQKKFSRRILWMRALASCVSVCTYIDSM